MNNESDNYLTEEINLYIRNKIPGMVHSISEARIPKPIVSMGRRIGFGAQQMGSLVKELGYKIRRNLEQSGAELRTDVQNITDINLTKDENILMRKHGLDPDYVRQVLKSYPTHADVRSRYPKPPTKRSERQKYQSLIDMATERQEVEQAVTHAKFLSPQLARTMKAKQESETSFLKNIAKRKEIASKTDPLSKKIEAEKRKRQIRARAFNIARKRS